MAGKLPQKIARFIDGAPLTRDRIGESPCQSRTSRSSIGTCATKVRPRWRWRFYADWIVRTNLAKRLFYEQLDELF